MQLPPGVDWYVWRVVTNPKLTGMTWSCLTTTANYDDLVTANDLLDALEFADALDAAKSNAAKDLR